MEAFYRTIFKLIVYFTLCWSQNFSSKLLFFQPASYKDVLGKFLYVVMTFLNTNGSILSFDKGTKLVPLPKYVLANEKY